MSENNGWFPIRTAPTDGTDVLVSVWAYDNVGGNRVCCVAKYSDGFGWLAMGTEIYTPTHWRPLPAPPMNAE